MRKWKLLLAGMMLMLSLSAVAGCGNNNANDKNNGTNGTNTSTENRLNNNADTTTGNDKNNIGTTEDKDNNRVDENGNVIPGLFACGTDSMGVLFNEDKAYTNYGGCAQSYCFVSGRDAGAYAAAHLED